MSDGVEPIPVEPVPVEPVPVEPVPVELLDEEVTAAVPTPARPPPLPPPPAWPTAYATPVMVRSGPPGLVRALGVCSIVVASLAMVGGGVVTVANLFAYTVSQVQAARAAAAVAQQTAATTAISQGPAEVVALGGLTKANRSAVVEGLGRSPPPLSAGQVAQLNELLAEDGQAIVGNGDPSDPSAMAGVAAAAVNDRGVIPTLGLQRPPTNYYVLANGRLEVGEDHAVFFPAGGQPAVRATAYDLPPLPADAAAPPLVGDDALRSILRTVARDEGARPSPPQVKAIVDLLRSPAQQVIVPTNGNVDPAVEVTSAQTDADDGSLTIQTQHGINTCDLTVTPAGQVSASLSSTSTVKVPPPNATAYRAVLLASLGQLALAVFLLVIGILTVRQNRLGGRLHWVYVGLKMVVGVLAVAATGWLWQSLSLGATVSGGGYTPWMLPALVGLAYPVAVAMLLLSKPVRDYYRAVA